VRKFRIAESDGEALLHDVLIAFMTTFPSIEHPRGWLVAAMCNASRRYWRCRARETEEIDDAVPDPFDACRLERELIVRDMLARLHPTDREVLRLHYFEHLTVPELAVRIGTTPRYAGKLVTKALKRARTIYEASAPQAAEPRLLRPSRPHDMTGPPLQV
jgi:RNA polymerase sigma factor (sigma-70 family)